MPGFLAEVLSKPHNRNYVTSIKTARSWGVPPRTMIFGEEPNIWTEQDVLLATALTVLEDETCKKCGTPVWWGYSTDNRIQFKIESSRCYGCEELEKEREQEQKNKVKSHGKVLYPIPYNFFQEQPLPSRKEAYKRREK